MVIFGELAVFQLGHEILVNVVSDCGVPFLAVLVPETATHLIESVIGFEHVIIGKEQEVAITIGRRDEAILNAFDWGRQELIDPSLEEVISAERCLESV